VFDVVSAAILYVRSSTLDVLGSVEKLSTYTIRETLQSDVVHHKLSANIKPPRADTMVISRDVSRASTSECNIEIQRALFFDTLCVT
jgi:hypothetical protein